MALTSQKGRDYDNPPPGCALTWQACDDPAPALDALSHGRVGDFFDLQPYQGPVTLVARAPVVAVVRSAGGDARAQYRWGALLCMLAVVALAMWLAGVAAARGLPFWLQALIAIGAVVNPVTSAVLKWGHPEEFAAVVFVVAALVSALRGRALGAGVLLGLAIATKAWALLAVPALLLTLPPAIVRRGLAAALITTGLLMAPMVIGSPQRFRDNVSEVGKLGSRLGTESTSNVLWPFATVKELTAGGEVVGGVAKVSPQLARGAHVAVFAAALLFAVAWWRRRSGAEAERALLLLALTLLVRNLLDPGTHSYYQVGPFLLLLAYETLTRRLFPFATAAFLVVFEATNRLASHFHSLDATNRIYLAWAIPFSIYMAWELLSRQHGTRAQVH